MITHFQGCTKTRRQNLWKAVQELEGDEEYLKTYLKARKYIEEAAAACPGDEAPRHYTAITILRMWRANELLGREDYLNQLKTFYAGTADNRGQSPNDKKYKYLVHGTDAAKALEAILTAQMMVEIFDLAFVSDVNFKNEPNQIIISIKEKYRKPQESYVSHEGIEIKPQTPSTTVAPEEKSKLDKYMRDIRSLTEIAAELNNGKKDPTSPLAYSVEIYKLQQDKIPGKPHDWTPWDNKTLLGLMGQGLPLVECTRILNDWYVGAVKPPITTIESVRPLAKDLLEW